MACKHSEEGHARPCPSRPAIFTATAQTEAARPVRVTDTEQVEWRQPWRELFRPRGYPGQSCMMPRCYRGK
eukprot:354869-Chlamydomonas_euryale.AAC.6